MITTRQFNEALEQVNKAFKSQDQKLAALEADLRDLKESLKEKSNASKKTRPKTS